MQLDHRLSRKVLAGAAAALTLLGVADSAQAQTTALIRPPEPGETIAIPTAPTATEPQAYPTQSVTFQSKLSNESKDQLEGWIWRPANLDPFARVPLVIVAHGHAGAGTYASPSKQFRTLGALLTSHGYGMMLVNSFSASRNAYIVATYGEAYNILNGLDDDPKSPLRTPETSDHLVRPWDVVGAAEWVREDNLSWVDPGKLIAVGYSHGGTAVLAAAFSNHPINLQNPTGGGRLFSKIFATYPGCGMGSLNNYKNSGAVTPTAVGAGTADPLSTNCTTRYTQSAAAAAADPALFTLEYRLYADAEHTWESTSGAANLATKADWRAQILAVLDTF